MSESTAKTNNPETSDEPVEGEHLHEYAGGEIKERPGRINLWLLPVYAGLFAWSLYYLFTEWRGLGPGLDY